MYLRIYLTYILIISLLTGSGCGKLNHSDKFLIKIKGDDFGSSIIEFFEKDGCLEFRKKLQHLKGFIIVEGKFFNENHFELIYCKDEEKNSCEFINYREGIVSIIDTPLNKILQFPYADPLIPSVLFDKKIKEIINSVKPKKEGNMNILNEVTKNIQSLTYEIIPFEKNPTLVLVNISIDGMEIISLYTETGEKIESLSSTGVHTFRAGFSPYLNMKNFGKSTNCYKKKEAISENIDFWGAAELKVSFYNFPWNYEAFSDMHQKVIYRDDSEISFVVNNRGLVREDKEFNKNEYLEQEYFIESEHLDIKSLVNRLMQSKQSDSKKCRVIMKWLQSNIEKVKTDEMSALQVLKHKKGDCQGFANLAVAMLRAAGLPAKVVYGAYLTPSSEQPFSFHAWIEVKLGNYWIAKDPILGKKEIEIHYIKFYDSSLESNRYNFNELINYLGIKDLEILRRKL